MKNLSIKARLSVLAIVPIIVILALSVGRIFYDIGIKENLTITKNRILEVESLAKAIHFMQIERGLSVGFSASNGTKNKDTLPEIRQKVDSAVGEIREIYAKTKGDGSVLNNLSELTQKRSAIDSLSVSAPDVGAYYSKIIVSIIDTATIIPSLMDDKDGRNTIQAYTHLASAKEQLGQIRANLNGAFTKDGFVGNTLLSFGGSLGAYKVNSRKFATLAPEELKKFYDSTFKGDAVDKTFAMIDIAQAKGAAGGFGVEPSIWFTNVTTSIDLLRNVELELYKTVYKSVDNKIEESFRNVMLLMAGLIIGITLFASFILYLTKTSISKPIENFKNTLLTISTN
ncbi:MAG: nitrate- and nitrite sensing domain-containing protein, partial [Campylobacterota bacterium]